MGDDFFQLLVEPVEGAAPIDQNRDVGEISLQKKTELSLEGIFPSPIEIGGRID